MRSTLLLSIIVIALLVGLGVALRPSPRMLSDRVVVDGRPYFLAGVNYPWKSGQEFGSGGWGYAGVATATTNAEIDADFANIAARGARVVKWRIFNDGRYEPNRDDRGFVTGVDPQLLADLQAALALAEKHDLHVVFTLFSSGFWTTDCAAGPVRFGGGAVTITDPAARASLVRNGVVPVLRAIGDNPRVLAFEIVAEPEWGVPGLNVDAREHEKGLIQIPLEPIRALVRDTARAVHLHTRALATVEANRASHMRYWQGLGLDYYSFSWYDWMEPWEPLDRPASALGLDRPVVIGEFPASGSKYYSLGEVLDLAYRNGYAGAFAWSFWGGDGFGWQPVAQQHLDWSRTRWDAVSLRPDVPVPPATAETVPPPYAIGDPKLSAFGADVRVDLDVQVRQPGSYQLQMVLQSIDPPGAWQQERAQAAGLPPSGQRRVSVRFNGLEEGRVLKLSLGIFDQDWNLLKWFDEVTLVQVQSGAIVVPNLTTENPCRSREATNRPS